MHDTLTHILERVPVLLDGAWGTQLQAAGLPIGGCPDEWNLSQPDRVEAVARSYAEAGSRVVLTNTFGASRFMLERHGLADRAAEINRRGAELSRRGAGDRVRVFGSIGPTGKMLMMGDVTEEQLRDAFREQAEALASGGAHGIVIETMADLEEACLAVRAAKGTGLPVCGCMVFDSGEHLDRTMMGIAPEQAAEGLAAAGADIIGANCGKGIEHFLETCRRLRASTERPIWIKANAGLPEIVAGQTVYRTTPKEFAARVPPLVQAGASFVGGCCGTSPEFIRETAAVLAGAG